MVAIYRILKWNETLDGLNSKFVETKEYSEKGKKMKRKKISGVYLDDFYDCVTLFLQEFERELNRNNS